MSHPASLGSSSVTTANYQPGTDNPAALSSGSGEQPTPEEVEAAIKIQKVVRGHLSRRNSEKLRSGFTSAAASPSHSRTPSTSSTNQTTTQNTTTSTPAATAASKPAKPSSTNSKASPLSSVTGAAQSAWQYVTSLPPVVLGVAGVVAASVAYVVFVANKPNQFSATVTTRRP